MKTSKLKFSLATQILIGLVLGIIVGAIFYENTTVQKYLQPLGDIFLNLIKMIVVPIIISSIIVAIAGVGDIKAVGKLGGKSLLYFVCVTMTAIIVGLVSANIFQPGKGVNMDNLEQTDISSYVGSAEAKEDQSIIDMIVHIVPANPFEAFVTTDMLAIIFFSVLFGLGVAAVGDKAKPVYNFFDGTAQIMFYITNLIMKFAPIGVFGLIGVTISKFGLESLIPLGKLVITVFGTMAFFVVVVLGLIAKAVGYSIFRLFKVLKAELILAFSTASSEAVLPRIMDKMEKEGCPRHISTFVIPTGYSFNLDGSTLYQALAALFIAQMYNIDLSVMEQVTLMLVLMITSKGIAGVPGVSFVVLLATLGTVGIPVEGLAFIAGIDRILDMGRTVVNVLGNALASVVIAKSEKAFTPPAESQQEAS